MLGVMKLVSWLLDLCNYARCYANSVPVNHNAVVSAGHNHYWLLRCVVFHISNLNQFFFSSSLPRLLCRYQLFLQVKQDVLQGRLPISFELAAELGAYIVQCK